MSVIMISLTVDEDQDLDFSQQDVAPTVYLDHWAMRTFASDNELGDRLVDALKKGEGTLAISLLNLGEFAKVSDLGQAEEAESLIERALPNIFFIDIDIAQVIKREDDLLAGGEPCAPHSCTEIVPLLTDLDIQSVAPFTARNLLRGIQEQSIADAFEQLANSIVSDLRQKRDRLTNDRGYRNSVRRLPVGPAIQRGTRYIRDELVRAIIIDTQTPINTNHAVDLLHATVPVAYCEFVLLDKHWETQVSRVKARLDDAAMGVPIAGVYSAKDDGIERFLSALTAD